MKKFLVKCEIIFDMNDINPPTESIIISAENSTEANLAAIYELEQQYPKALRVAIYQTDKIEL